MQSESLFINFLGIIENECIQRQTWPTTTTSGKHQKLKYMLLDEPSLVFVLWPLYCSSLRLALLWHCMRRVNKAEVVGEMFLIIDTTDGRFRGLMCT